MQAVFKHSSDNGIYVLCIQPNAYDDTAFTNFGIQSTVICTEQNIKY